jgi:hypothetical protein
MNQRNKSKIHFVYFSCARHFGLLYASLISLSSLYFKNIGNVYLYIDRNDFFTPEQRLLLKKLKLNIKLIKAASVSGWGAETVIVELQAFFKIKREISSDDYLAKVDSDVLFISDNLFKVVLNESALLIGEKEVYWSPCVFTQGGCYFLKGELISNISFLNNKEFFPVLIKILTEQTKRALNKVARRRNLVILFSCPEDAAVFNLLKLITDKIKFVRSSLSLYLIKRKMESRGKKFHIWLSQYLQNEKYLSIIHFKSKKAMMSDVFKAIYNIY